MNCAGGSTGQVTTLGLLTGPPPFATPVFVNPMHGGELQERLDLGTQNTLDDEDADRLVALLAERLPDCQAVVVSEILGPALFTTRLREGIQKLIDAHPDKLFVVDTRTQADVWRGAVLRFNAHEGAAILVGNIPQQVPYRSPLRIRPHANSPGRPGARSFFRAANAAAWSPRGAI